MVFIRDNIIFGLRQNLRLPQGAQDILHHKGYDCCDKQWNTKLGEIWPLLNQERRMIVSRGIHRGWCAAGLNVQIGCQGYVALL